MRLWFLFFALLLVRTADAQTLCDDSVLVVHQRMQVAFDAGTWFLNPASKRFVHFDYTHFSQVPNAIIRRPSAYSIVAGNYTNAGDKFTFEADDQYIPGSKGSDFVPADCVDSTIRDFDKDRLIPIRIMDASGEGLSGGLRRRRAPWFGGIVAKGFGFMENYGIAQGDTILFRRQKYMDGAEDGDDMVTAFLVPECKAGQVVVVRLKPYGQLYETKPYWIGEQHKARLTLRTSANSGHENSSLQQFWQTPNEIFEAYPRLIRLLKKTLNEELLNHDAITSNQAEFKQQ